MAQRPLEQAVQHLQSITSPFNLDLKILTAGLADACSRIEALENINATALAKPAPKPGEAK